jgi:hypothetical protein
MKGILIQAADKEMLKTKHCSSEDKWRTGAENEELVYKV